MSKNPNVGRKFNYESVKEYYDAKMAIFPDVPTPVLHDLHTFSLEDLTGHFKVVANSIDLNRLIPAGSKSWEQIITDLSQCAQQTLWKFRDYVFSVTMIWVGQFLSNNVNYKTNADGKAYIDIISDLPRFKPEKIELENNEFTVIGSQKVTSDIDVTVQGPGAYFIIMILEDLFTKFTDAGVSIRRMDLEFYTDFRIAQKAYVNVNKFSIDEKVKILKYAYISYFRSTHTTELSPLATVLGNKFLGGLGDPVSLDAVIADAKAEWLSEAPDGVLDREKFYEKAKQIDDKTKKVYHLFISQKWQGIAAKVVSLAKQKRASFAEIVPEVLQSRLAIDLFFLICKANIHRAESYILPSTAVHVVDIEQLQDKREVNSNMSSYFGITPLTGVEKFTYIASAIEQLGYLEHYHPSGQICSIKGIKYVGRMIRALINAGLLTGNEYFSYQLKGSTITDSYTEIYNKLNSLRKLGASACDINIKDLDEALVDKLESIVTENPLEVISENPLRTGGYRRNKKVTRRRRSRSSRKRRTYGNRR